MTEDIDRLIASARPASPAGLSGLESDVWRRIEDRVSEGRMGQVRVAALAMALVVGVANGGLFALSARAEPSEMQVFSVSAGLSPIGTLGAGE
ncbi:hypothetical protein [Brevundimonas subvibrioides]|jgi:hypothetical protein|uniref:Uncharacterized protein n=1 Tax=Brevundimonas subvibrioides (strain ATCC 15264 / DSM 4735 / LMG 14903 / NBRC 16000 / CB 81) TaxID=633149 RepID=D9QH12_BRESC|nr:hypothetical protein [Brevundimonas subvibrioides]ADL00978.1 conserved hypothetical protein [Brevundimonas subvibrioides ATCC 15264]